MKQVAVEVTRLKHSVRQSRSIRSESHEDMSLRKGRHNPGRLVPTTGTSDGPPNVSPFQGFGLTGRPTQGVALGCHIAAPLGLRIGSLVP